MGRERHLRYTPPRQEDPQNRDLDELGGWGGQKGERGQASLDHATSVWGGVS